MSADSWIYSTLVADSTLQTYVGSRIYQDLAPEGTAYPLIVFNLVDVIPDENAYADNIMDIERWDIRVIVKENSYANAKTIASQIRTLLHKASATGIVASRFIQALRLTEHDSSGIYKTISQEFEIYTQ